jgi:hypothetical protein
VTEVMEMALLLNNNPMGKFSLLNHFYHFWQAYLQMVNSQVKIKPAMIVYNHECTYLQKPKAYGDSGVF